jgi:non-canonical purine NTP pyrophosphatase (RdgB/HAM1 family)
LLRNPISRALLLAGVCLLAITPFFWWGSPSGHDFEFHMDSWMEVLGQWKQGIAYPRWAALAHWGYGEARFLFYPPASWTLGAALGAILPWKFVPGAYCLIVLLLAGASMYRLAREWLPSADAWFAAVFYALNPYHLLIVYWRSAYAELLAASLLPLVPLFVLRLQEPVSGPPDAAGCGETLQVSDASEERAGGGVTSSTTASAGAAGGSSNLCRQDRFRPTLCLSLTLAAAWLTNAPAAMMIHYSTAGMALFLAARKAFENRSWGPPIWRPLVRTALAILLGAGLASFYLLPAVYERGWINLSEVMAPGVRPQDNFLFTKISDLDHNRFNFLVSTIALAEICVLGLAIWASRNWQKKRMGTGEMGGPIARSATMASVSQRPRILFSAWGAASALLMLSVSNLLWEHLPEFRYVQLPFRWLLCMNAALAMLLTLAFKRWTSRVLAFSVLLSVVVIAGYRIQPPWWDTGDDIVEISDALDNGSGYEGTDEYIPAGDDAYELNKDLPRVSDDTGAAVQTEVLVWRQREKHFIVHATAPQDLTVRLFSYPAWDVVVNGKPAETEKTDVTGLIVIPISAGDNDIHIYFRRTIDRLIGNIVSLISLLGFVVAWFKLKERKLAPPDTRRANLSSLAAPTLHTVLVATSNSGKLRDFAGAAAPYGITIANIPHFGSLPPVVEDGATFEENARKKAEFYSLALPGELVLADDSGLEVDALGGAPGVHSARYAAAEPHAAECNTDDEANNTRVLREIKNVPEQKRTARFVCVLVVARDGQTVQTFRGAAEGLMLSEPRGQQGFGYDPLFYFPQIGKTFAELSAVEKAQYSHRGAAFRAFLSWYRASAPALQAPSRDSI